MITTLLAVAGCALLFAFTALMPLRTEEGGCGACGKGRAGGCGLAVGSDGRCPLERPFEGDVGADSHRGGQRPARDGVPPERPYHGIDSPRTGSVPHDRSEPWKEER